MSFIAHRSAALLATLLAVSSAQADVRATIRAPKAPTAIAVVIEYQRVGHDLLALQHQRGVFDCGDLMPRFRTIKLEQAVATPATRLATAATLADLAIKIERLRGIHITAECRENPLAAGCR